MTEHHDPEHHHSDQSTEFERAVLLILTSIERKLHLMSTTLTDVQAALADLDATTSTALADIAADLTALNTEVAALQQQIGSGQAPPDLSSLVPLIAAIKAKVLAADPGPQPVPAPAPTPST